ncbi:MAG: NAD-dependent deacetylase, partial [Moraxellaceae bacterium]
RDLQLARYRQWPALQPVVIELGAGTAIAGVRHFGESLHAPLIRINPREPEVTGPQAVSLPMGALAALQALDRLLA